MDVVGTEATVGGREDGISPDRVANKCRATRQTELRITYGGLVSCVLWERGSFGFLRRRAAPAKDRTEC